MPKTIMHFVVNICYQMRVPSGTPVPARFSTLDARDFVLLGQIAEDADSSFSAVFEEQHKSRERYLLRVIPEHGNDFWEMTPTALSE
jgi:hypothetical protein